MIVLLETVHPDAVSVLEKIDDVVLVDDPPHLGIEGELSEVKALVTRGLGRVDASMLSSLPNLIVVGRCGAGLDNIDLDAAAEAGVTVVNAPGLTAGAVAEHAMMLTLALARQLGRIAPAVAEGDWVVRDGIELVELAGKRMGIVGMGSIGQRVAHLGAAFGMDVVYWNRRKVKSEATRLELEELLKTSDVIQICVAHAIDTEGLIDAPAFSAMSSSTLLVNTSRGSIVDHDALAAALLDGGIGGYGADVWLEEPPQALDLLKHPRVIVTPHVAAFTDRSYRAICVRAAEAVGEVLDMSGRGSHD